MSIMRMSIAHNRLLYRSRWTDRRIVGRCILAYADVEVPCVWRRSFRFAVMRALFSVTASHSFLARRIRNQTHIVIVPMKAPNARNQGCRLLAIIGLFSIVAAARGQVVTAPMASTPLPSDPLLRTSSSPISLSQLASAFQHAGPLAKWGPVSVRPYVAFRFLYEDGLAYS